MIPVASSGPTPGLDATGEVPFTKPRCCIYGCQTRWWFKYGLKYADPPTGGLTLGRAVHSGARP